MLFLAVSLSLSSIVSCIIVPPSTTQSYADDGCQAAINLAACLVLESKGISLPLPCQELIVHGIYRSCKEILCNNSSATSGIYNILLSDGSRADVYCDMDGDDCGGIGGWTRIAHVNMTEPNATCPEGLLQSTRGDLELCERLSSGDCDSSHFTTHGIEYQQVCGRIRGYQLGTPEAFSRSIVISSLTLESQYLDGISFTHGAPSERVHIWSFPAGVTITRNDRFGCPCVSGSTVSSPSFVGDDYYCDSVATGIASGTFYTNGQLWDGVCPNMELAPCCANMNSPWFIKTLAESTSDDIEMRMCTDESNVSEGTPLDLIELYIY